MWLRSVCEAKAGLMMWAPHACTRQIDSAPSLKTLWLDFALIAWGHEPTERCSAALACKHRQFVGSSDPLLQPPVIETDINAPDELGPGMRRSVLEAHVSGGVFSASQYIDRGRQC